MTGRLAGTVAVVTGAASGIGRGILEAFVAEGAVTVGVDRHDADITADLTDDEQIADIARHMIQHHGGCQVLVNNAGICPPGTVLTTDPHTWDQVQQINVRAVYLLSRALLPSMIENSAGSIINIASNYALVGGRNAAAYAASKGAVVALSRAMALDHATDGIRVNAICPGTVDTALIREPMTALTSEEAQQITADRLRRHPLGRLGQPADVAQAAIYLASDEATWVTGATFAIDGGYTAQ